METWGEKSNASILLCILVKREKRLYAHTLIIIHYVHINMEAKPRLRGRTRFLEPWIKVICIMIAHRYMVNWLRGRNIVSCMALGAAEGALNLL